MISIGPDPAVATWLTRVGPRTRLAGVQSELEALVLADPFHFDAVAFRRRLTQGTRPNERGPRRVAFSWARLAGCLHTGGHDTVPIADRLHAALPEAKVIVSIREQRAALRLAYTTYLLEGGASDLRRYIAPTKRYPVYPGFALTFLEYHRLVEVYRSRFGERSVLVLTAESLERDPSGAFARVGAFLDLDAARYPGAVPAAPSVRRPRARSAARASVLRWRNALLARGALNHAALLPVLRIRGEMGMMAGGARPRYRHATDARLHRDRLDDQIDMLVQGRYEPSNRLLADSMDVDLRGTGYAV